MLNRSWLLLIAVFLTSPIFAKDKGFYLPLTGYTALWNKNTEKTLHSACLGMIGYTFSEDWKVELTGFGCFESIAKLVPSQRTPIKTQPKRAPNTPHRSLMSPQAKRSDLPNNPPEGQRRDTLTHYLKESVSGHRLTTEQMAADIDKIYTENPWVTESTGQTSPPKLTEAIDPELLQSMNSDRFLPATPDNTTSHVSKADSLPSDTNTHDVLESGHPAPINTIEPNLNSEPTEPLPVFWGGITLMSKWTFLHLHPQLRFYWGPGLSLLYPDHNDLKVHGFANLNFGAHWIINSKLSVDCSVTRLFHLFGDNKRSESHFSEKKLTSFNIGFHWHF